MTSKGDQLWSVDSSGIEGDAFYHDRFGWALRVGDFDGDGFDDLAVSRRNVGVHAIYGTAAGLTSTGVQLWSQSSRGIEEVAEADGYFGNALGVGDFDGDGFDDLAVGVPYQDHGGHDNNGVVHLMYGIASGLSSTGDQLWFQDSLGIEEVAETQDWFGSSP